MIMRAFFILGLMCHLTVPLMGMEADGRTDAMYLDELKRMATPSASSSSESESSSSSEVAPQQKIARTVALIHHPEKIDQFRGMKKVAGKIPAEIKDLIHYLKNKDKYQNMGAVLPTGLLLVGKPGTGKTSIIESIAQETGFPLVVKNGASFTGSLAGSEQKNIVEAFKEVREKSKAAFKDTAILFIDEFDALGSRQGQTNLNQWYVQGITTMLTEMEKRSEGTTEYVFGATNAPERIDPAFKRPGRFDRVVEIPLPDEKDREEIFRFYARAIKYDTAIDFSALAKISQGLTPADIKFIVNEAAVHAVRAEADHVNMEHFLQAGKNFLNRMLSSSKSHL